MDSSSSNAQAGPSSFDPSILSTAHALQTSLLATFSPLLPSPSSHLLHPLGPLPPSSLSSRRQLLTTTLADLRTACTTFASHTLSDVPDSSAVRGPVRAGTEKYLSLLKESAGSQSILLERREDARRGKELLARREEYAGRLPVLEQRLLEGGEAERTLRILESVAESCGLACFQEKGLLVKEGKELEVHTLSIGGKVMVMDLEVHEEGVVDKIKFMYVLENEHVDEGIAKRLLEKLVGLDKVGQGEQEEARGEKKLREFREIVRELKRLDEMTEETTMDCFAITSKMAESIVAVLEGEGSHNLEPSSHGIYLSQPLHSHTSILYYASPSRLLSPEWSSAVTDNFSVDSSAKLHDTEGVYSLDINLEKPGSTGALDYLGASTSTQPDSVSPLAPSFPLHLSQTGRWPHFVPTSPSTSPIFLAKLHPPVPITKATGKRIMDVLGLSGSGAERPATGGARAGAGGETTWFEDLLVSSEDGPITRFDAQDSYRVNLDDTSLAQEYTLADASTLPGYLCSHIRFQSPAQLFRVIEILKEQLLINDLLRSALSPRYRLPPPPPTKSSKRRKLTPISLDDLFQDETRTSVPIFLHPSSAPLSVSVSFPSPHTALALATPVSILIAPDLTRSSGLRMVIKGSREVEEALRGEMAEKVVESTRDVPLLMRWVVKKLERLREEGEGGMELS